jgi:molybdopterin-containing oxidoreductase family iron-sulfur binding subunit
VHACHVISADRPSNNSYIRVFEMQSGGIDFEQGDAHVIIRSRSGKFYMRYSVSSAKPALHRRVRWNDLAARGWHRRRRYNWCIGCRYCEAACPYHARRFNWSAPEIPAEEINPDQGLLSNRIRPQGVVEKCTFCLHHARGPHAACQRRARPARVFR